MKTILIIDDQLMYLKSLEFALKKNFAVLIASNYNEALEKLKNNVDIALIDIRLDESDESNMDGLKILEWVKINKPEIAVFMMSAYREFSYAEQSLNLGAKHFFRKPIDVTNLVAILEEKA
ncbi:MAG: response regulator [Candidatus Lokiarchaeota archaeon]|nr:response regulator [Candidatus Lokiarchaeota archaeon]